MVIVPLALAIFSISFACEDKTKTEYHIFYEMQPLVYVTETGECYHSYNCRYLSKSCYPKGMYQAIASGYRACSTCGGRGYGTVQAEVRAPYQVVDYTAAIFFSLVKVVFLTPLVYIPIYKLLDKTNCFQD